MFPLFSVGEVSQDEMDQSETDQGLVFEGAEELSMDHDRQLVRKSIEMAERFDKFDHWVQFDSWQSGTRCKYNKCNKTIHTYCSKCGVYLCCLRDRNCFKSYHHRE